MQLHRLVYLVAELAVCGPAALAAQRPDSLTRTDSARKAAALRPVTIVATPAQRAEPVSATHVTAETIRATPALNTYDLLRQTAGLEVHLQGQGPGFASDASLRGFSSDHSTDLALWIDGVPVNEPVNGHAEDTTTSPCSFPEGCRTSMCCAGRRARCSATSRSPAS